MYILKRCISPYTGADIILGCFRTVEEAQHARHQYIQPYQNGTKRDPWKKQAYKPHDQLQDDVIIIDDLPVHHITPTLTDVYILSTFAEGFGQIIRHLVEICGSEESVQFRRNEIEKTLGKTFPEYCAIQKVAVGKLLPDDTDIDM